MLTPQVPWSGFLVVLFLQGLPATQAASLMDDDTAMMQLDVAPDMDIEDYYNQVPAVPLGEVVITHAGSFRGEYLYAAQGDDSQGGRYVHLWANDSLQEDPQARWNISKVGGNYVITHAGSFKDEYLHASLYDDERGGQYVHTGAKVSLHEDPHARWNISNVGGNYVITNVGSLNGGHLCATQHTFHGWRFVHTSVLADDPESLWTITPVAKESTQQACHTAVEGEACHQQVRLAMQHGIMESPGRYLSLTADSSFEEFQALLHGMDAWSKICPKPCEEPKRDESTEQEPVRLPSGSPTTNTDMVSGIGDPHLSNLRGEHFDIYQTGSMALIHLPRFAEPARTLLLVEAEARHMGDECSVYFQVVSISGLWTNQSTPIQFYANPALRQSLGAPEGNNRKDWMRFGSVDLRVLRRKKGVFYLNVYARNVSHSGHEVGGLLGLDDHADVARRPRGCGHRHAMALMSSVAEAE